MEYVTAPRAVPPGTDFDNSWELSPGSTVSCAVVGAWAILARGPCRGMYECRFAGNHQDVVFATCGRTPGRALRKMRRELAVAALPVR